MSGSQEGGYHRDSSGVWVVDRDRLILVAVVPDNTLNQYVEWSAQEYVVGRVLNDMELYILRNVSDEDGHIAGEAQSLVNFVIC